MADDDLDKYRKIGMKIRNEAKGGMLVASIVGFCSSVSFMSSKNKY